MVLSWSKSFMLALFLFLRTKTVLGDKLDEAIQNALEELNICGASIAYFERDKIKEPIIRGYGRVSSDVNSQSVSGDTSFMLASVSKVFAGAVVLSLIDKNIISLDDDICDAIPEDWDRSACRNPNYPDTPVTWRMMVTHRSSLRGDIPMVQDSDGDWVYPEYGPTGGYENGEAAGGPSCPLEDTVGFYRDFLIEKDTETSIGAGITLLGGQKLNWYEVGKADGGAWRKFRPGSKNVYSNLATGYIAALVELKTGKNFAEYSKTNIFDPLGMTNTAWFSRDLPSESTEATPVQVGGINNDTFIDVGQYCFVDYPSGQLKASANDMSKWLKSMLDYGSPSLWSKETGKQAFACQEQDEKGDFVSNCEFGINWIRLDDSNKSSPEFWLEPFTKFDWTDGVMHDGYEAGVQTQVLVLPAAGVYVAVLTNTNLNGDSAAQALASEIVSNLPPTDITNDIPSTGCPSNQVRVAINIMFDSFPNETSWVLESNSTVVVEGGPYDEGDPFVDEMLCLDEGLYNFTIFDEYGDGICCDAGDGGYYIMVDGVEVGSGGSFDSSDSIDFYAQNFPPTDRTNDISSASCPPSDIEVVINIVFDNYPNETSWILESNSTVVAHGGPYEQGDPFIDEMLCLDEGLYNFTIFDEYGDGICCDAGDGGYYIMVDGVEVGSGGSFDSFDFIDFYV